MNVLFVVTAYPRNKDDIITPWLVQLIKRLRQKGINVSVFTSSYKGLGNQNIEGIPIYRFRYFFKRFERLTHEETAIDRVGRGLHNLFLTFAYLILGARAVIRLVKMRKFDIIHIHWPFPHIIFGLLAKGAGRARLFSSFYGAEIRWLKKKFPLFIKPFSWLLNKSDVITAISHHTANELKGIAKKRIHIIPFSSAVVESDNSAQDKNKIIFVGRLVERKGVKYLLEAFKKIEYEIPYQLIIIGDGPEKQQLEDLSQHLGLKKRVTFTGRISDAQLNSYYQECSFLVLPAVYDKKGDTEGLGVVLLEAMSHSKPVIASNVGGITDIVESGFNGLLVPPMDTDSLARAIKKLALDKSQCRVMGRNAKKTVDERFNWNTIVNNLIALYKNYE